VFHTVQNNQPHIMKDKSTSKQGEIHAIVAECRKQTHPPRDSSQFIETTHGRSKAKTLEVHNHQDSTVPSILWTKMEWQTLYHTNPLKSRKINMEFTKQKTHTFLKRKTTDTWCYTQHYIHKPELSCHSSSDVMIHRHQFTPNSQKKGTGHASTPPPICTPRHATPV
jgi:hypothetical protein